MGTVPAGAVFRARSEGVPGEQIFLTQPDTARHLGAGAGLCFRALGTSSLFGEDIREMRRRICPIVRFSESSATVLRTMSPLRSVSSKASCLSGSGFVMSCFQGRTPVYRRTPPRLVQPALKKRLDCQVVRQRSSAGALSPSIHQHAGPVHGEDRGGVGSGIYRRGQAGAWPSRWECGVVARTIGPPNRVLVSVPLCSLLPEGLETEKRRTQRGRDAARPGRRGLGSDRERTWPRSLRSARGSCEMSLAGEWRAVCGMKAAPSPGGRSPGGGRSLLGAGGGQLQVDCVGPLGDVPRQLRFLVVLTRDFLRRAASIDPFSGLATSWLVVTRTT